MIHIVGIGNEWASDDGIGPVVARHLEKRLSMGEKPFPVRVFTFARPDLSLLEAMDECAALVVVDAIASNNRPGTVHVLEWSARALASRGVERASSHGFGVRETLALAESLGKLPQQALLLGVEIASTEPGRGLSPALEAALPEIVTFCEKVIRAL
ncbi:MAG: hydrogenase maturation protease [Chloroflexi bacterium]|nr:hydrogenase maturation protease [Chloroflexota bacterium]